MMRLVALVLVVSLVVVARAAGGEGTERFATMALGFLLIAAPILGEAGEHVGLPRITGYLLVGLATGPELLGLLTPTMTAQLRLVNGLAVALIAFGAGMELDAADLVKQGRSLGRHTALLVLGVFGIIVAITLAVSPLLPFAAGATWPRRIAIALVAGATLATFSPTVVMAVLAETRAKGPLADRVLAIVVAGDLGLVLIFTLATTLARALDGRSAELGMAALHVVWELVGSILFGLLAGVGITIYRALHDRRSELLVAGVCLILAEVGGRLGLSPLLCCLSAGLVVRNAAPEAAEEMHHLLARVRLPVLVIFFAAAGASLHLRELVTLAPVVLGAVLMRVGAIFVANRWAARAAGFPEALAKHVPAGLISQAGVTLGLAVIVGREFGEWGQAVQTILLAVISVQQLVGPVLFRRSLMAVGEVPVTPEAELPAEA